MSRFVWGRPALGFALVAAAAASFVAWATAAGAPNWYNRYDLVSDGPAVPAPLADSALVNGWGLSAGPATPWWTANNKTNTSTLYNGGGAKSALTVNVPGGPTGTVFNGTPTDFVVSRAARAARPDSSSPRRPARSSGGRRR